MSFANDLRQRLEEEEARTVGGAFGGARSPGKSLSFSVAGIADWILGHAADEHTEEEGAVQALCAAAPKNLVRPLVQNAVRHAFMIELTNLTVGSTKMKCRWVPGKILMPQQGSFEPTQGTFQPGGDPRSSDFRTCLDVFVWDLRTATEAISSDQSAKDLLTALKKHNSVPYEFPVDYADADADPVHHVGNLVWVANDDIRWLVKVRAHLKGELPTATWNKIKTKSYKTDRSLTGKDKTNRAKRWEVLAGDFQHASLTECWSVERQLLEELVLAEGFPEGRKSALVADDLVAKDASATTCPVTHEILPYSGLVSPSDHGVSDYQIGHLTPLKRGGAHCGSNVAWQSANGNRIQGDLTLEETIELLRAIAMRHGFAA